jgi:hypothetical protein
MEDVFEALKPKRVVRNSVRLFAIYPVKDPVATSRLIREHYYQGVEVDHLFPN